MPRNPQDQTIRTNQDINTLILHSGRTHSSPEDDTHSTKVLQVNQVWGDLLLESKHFARHGRPVTIGASTGSQWRFLGIELGWVRSPFDRILPLTPPIWSEVTTEWRTDFYTPTPSLPRQEDYALFAWEGAAYVAIVDRHWDGFADIGTSRHTFPQLVTAGRATQTEFGYAIPVTEDIRLVIDIGESIYVAEQVYPGRKAITAMAQGIDYPMVGIFALCAFLGMMFGASMSLMPPSASNETVEIPDRFVELLLERPTPTPQPVDIRSAPADSEEGPKAKKDEGKLGKKTAKMKKAKGDKQEIERVQRDRQVAENAGVLGALRHAGLMDGVFGRSGLSEALTRGVGGMIGAKGVQLGTSGLSSRGASLGGGGTAVALTGLGTKGLGAGTRSFGADGGGGPSKTRGDINARGGDPIILGALDRSLIDEVIKRSMSQIRYCYQRELTKNPSLSGKIVTKFTIAGDGTVSSAATRSSTLNNENVEQCVVSRFYRMQFPEPKEGGVVFVSYPFLFSPS
jgi:hypothetical protein